MKVVVGKKNLEGKSYRLINNEYETMLVGAQTHILGPIST
jgi:hypothetical protein